MTVQERVEKVLSEIYSDMYDCKITIRFGRRPEEETKETEDGTTWDAKEST